MHPPAKTGSNMLDTKRQFRPKAMIHELTTKDEKN
jgi:hypothetical protein